MSILERIEENDNVMVMNFSSTTLAMLLYELADNVFDFNLKAVDKLVNNIGSEYDKMLFASCVSGLGRVMITNFKRGRRFDFTCFSNIGKWEVGVARDSDYPEGGTVILLSDPQSDFVNMIVLE